MADTKTTYPDGTAGQSGAKRDGNVPNQGGSKSGQGSDYQNDSNSANASTDCK